MVPSEPAPFDQAGPRLRLSWGRRGARAAAERGDALVVVDTLSFATATAVAVARGGEVIPCAPEADAAALARELAAEPAVKRRQTGAGEGFSLSPVSFLTLPAGTRVVLPSPNGAFCSRLAARVPRLWAGALVNASAVAAAVQRWLEAGSGSVTVLACGERWAHPVEGEPLRVALEDALGAGAILAGLRGTRSPEAAHCETAFRASRASLEEMLWESGSGRELRAWGYGEDVRLASRLDAWPAVPTWQGDRFAAAQD